MLQGTLHSQGLVQGYVVILGTSVYKVLESSEGLLQWHDISGVSYFTLQCLCLSAAE